jgi:hypothetical protein
MSESDETFLARMNAKLADPKKPLFTPAEAARCYRIVMSEDISEEDEFISEYCVAWLNNERNDLCFYK